MRKPIPEKYKQIRYMKKYLRAILKLLDKIGSVPGKELIEERVEYMMHRVSPHILSNRFSNLRLLAVKVLRAIDDLAGTNAGKAHHKEVKKMEKIVLFIINKQLKRLRSFVKRTGE